jgi:hypothetical protein
VPREYFFHTNAEGLPVHRRKQGLGFFVAQETTSHKTEQIVPKGLDNGAEVSLAN